MVNLPPFCTAGRPEPAEMHREWIIRCRVTPVSDIQEGGGAHVSVSKRCIFGGKWLQVLCLEAWEGFSPPGTWWALSHWVEKLPPDSQLWIYHHRNEACWAAALGEQRENSRVESNSWWQHLSCISWASSWWIFWGKRCEMLLIYPSQTGQGWEEEQPACTSSKGREKHKTGSEGSRSLFVCFCCFN